MVARNIDNLNKVADACKTAGAPDVLVLSKDLSIADECISAVEDTVAHFKGVYLQCVGCHSKYLVELVNFHPS